jgi:hypothetical protein
MGEGEFEEFGCFDTFLLQRVIVVNLLVLLQNLVAVEFPFGSEVVQHTFRHYDSQFNHNLQDLISGELLILPKHTVNITSDSKLEYLQGSARCYILLLYNINQLGCYEQ